MKSRILSDNDMLNPNVIKVPCDYGCDCGQVEGSQNHHGIRLWENCPRCKGQGWLKEED